MDGWRRALDRARARTEDIVNDLDAVYKVKGKPPRGSADPMAAFAECIPSSCAGKTVLDLGGHEGHFSRLCLDRGAFSATVVDNKQFSVYPEPDMRVSGPTYVTKDLMDYEGTPADIVLFSNVLYHAKDPYTMMEKVASLATETVCLMCWVATRDEASEEWYLKAPYEEHPRDPTIYWIPSAGGLLKLSRIVGLTPVWSVIEGNRMAMRCTVGSPVPEPRIL